ncbi:MFS transporter [Marinobacterium sedimentorum]|uniref:MFS transporter n=1 Tax=Marinobacterium sedimentorum TaxID=2927804 RepID=UPI0020C5B569|nr:MFS transporter [Marinobacterium sedimentorum]MCP8687362.1 MFS transporter [Marinobacterium sedimentorum]
MSTPGYGYLLQHQKGLLGIALLAVFSGNLGQSFFIGLFQAPLADKLGLSAGEFGSAYAAVTLCAGFLVLNIGPTLDWIPPRRFALMVLAGMTGGILLLTLSPWFLPAVLGLGLVRLCGQGLFTHLGNTLAGREFTVARGRALGLVSLGVPMGEMLLPPLVALVLLVLGWQALWWSFIGVLLLAWLSLMTLLPWPSAPAARPDRGQRGNGPRPLRERRFWRLLPLLMTLPITMTGIFIYQAQMTADFGASLTTYALALTAMGAARLPGALLAGRWGDQIGPQRIARLFILPFALALMLALLVGGDIGIWLLLIGGGLTMGMQEPVVNSLLVSLWGGENLGRVRSTLSACMVFATGIAPALLGFLIDWDISFQRILLGALAGLVLAWLLSLKTLAEPGRAPAD